MIVKAKGPSGPAKIRSDDPKHALSLVLPANNWLQGLDRGHKRQRDRGTGCKEDRQVKAARFARRGRAV